MRAIVCCDFDHSPAAGGAGVSLPVSTPAGGPSPEGSGAWKAPRPTLVVNAGGEGDYPGEGFLVTVVWVLRPGVASRGGEGDYPGEGIPRPGTMITCDTEWFNRNKHFPSIRSNC